MLVVWHDRQILNRTYNRIWEIDEHSRQLKEYTGNYDADVEPKVVVCTLLAEKYERQQEEVRRLRKRDKWRRQIDLTQAHYRPGAARRGPDPACSRGAHRLFATGP